MAPQTEPYEIRAAVVTIIDRDALLGTLREIAHRHNTHIVCFDAEKIAGLRHAEFAVRHAQHTRYNGVPISNSFEMEALLYAAGSRQCSVATSFGIHDGENHLYVCCCPACDGAWKDLDRHLCFVPETGDGMTAEKTARLMELFGITPEEIDAAGSGQVTALVLERVAFLEVCK